MKAFSFPWKLSEVPHGLIDIIRSCNVSCQGCYNVRSNTQKSLQEIADNLDALMAARALHTVSIVGGEPTLHPQLLDIIHLIKKRNLRVALVTNGVLINDDYARQLKQAGLDLAFLHIDVRQKRQDSPLHPSREMLTMLRNKKARSLKAQNIDVGLQITVYQSTLSELNEEIKFFSESADIHYLFVTGFTEMKKFKDLQGDLKSGFCGVVSEFKHGGTTGEEVSIEDIAAFCAKDNLSPFIYLGSSLDRRKPRWLIYKIAVLRHHDGRFSKHMLTSSLLERMAIEVQRLIGGRYFYYQTLDAEKFKWQIILNALMGGRMMGNLLFALKALPKKNKLYEKHILIQQGPTMTEKGVLEYCRDCPDAVHKAGRLVPVCISDMI